MSLTPNFGMNIPDATDIVNLLTQCYPNFTLLDGALQSIKETGVTSASETKSGTVHQLVRTDGDCTVLRFTATSNFVTGDTFTVDGTPVTGVSVSGASLQTGDFVINSNVLAIVNGGVLTLFAGGSAPTPAANDVTYDNSGSGLTATDVQDAIDELAGDIPTSMAASAITYDNTGSGLTATDVQDAIDEVYSMITPPGSVYELKEHTVGAATACDITKDGILLTTLNNTGVTTFSDTLINVSFVSGWVLKANVNVTADGVPVAANGTIFTIGSYSGVTKTARIVAQ